MTSGADIAWDGLSELWRARIMAVLRSFPEVSRAIVYGSRARGRFRRGSDLDLALETVDGKPMDADRKLELASLLNALDVPIDVDVVDRASVRTPEFAAAIERDGKVWWTAESGVVR